MRDDTRICYVGIMDEHMETGEQLVGPEGFRWRFCSREL